METAIKRMKETAMKMKRTANWLSKALVVALVTAGGLLGISTSAIAAADYGYEGNSYAGVGNPPTSDKPQSKLWWHDGSWWADMWTTGTGWQIHRLDVASKTWVSTGLTNDTRTNTLSDTLWDGTHLYIASHLVSVSGDTTSQASIPGQPAKLYRYSYSGGKFTLDSGFPTTIMNNSSESMTIDQDSTGAIWATWTQVSGSSASGFTNTVYVNRSAPGGTSWNSPFVIPVTNPNLAPDDISAIVAYGSNKIGVMWSDQLSGAVRWATHTDGTSPTATSSWNVQDAVRGPKYADDHLNLKTLQSDNSGRVFAAIKTGLNDTQTDPSLAEVELLVFKPGTGSFSVTTIATIGDCVSRPQIVLDTENNTVHAFHTAPGTDVSGCAYSGIPGAIYEKTASMDNPVFPSGRGTPIIQDGSSANMNDVTTSKQSVNSTTGLVVLASNNVTKRYWFSYRPLGGTTVPPEVSPFADVSTGQQFYKEMAWLADQDISTGWPEANGTVTYRPLQSISRDAMAAFLYRAAGSPEFTAPAVSPFADVSTGQQFYKEMAWLADQDISMGWPEANGTVTYRPLQAINRDAMAAFLYRAAGSPDFTDPAVSPFADVSTGQQFYTEMAWLADQDISTGWPEANGTVTYRPLQAINRDAMAAFLYRWKNPAAI